ncbi:MAG: 23S rRNA pseudouridylate synthase B, partial [Methylotenera sp.]
EWAGLDVPQTPHKQLSKHEKDKATAVFRPKVHKRRGSVLAHPPKEKESEGKVVKSRKPSVATNKPPKRKSVKRRIRS